jgi:hypothetical protein
VAKKGSLSWVHQPTKFIGTATNWNWWIWTNSGKTDSEKNALPVVCEGGNSIWLFSLQSSSLQNIKREITQEWQCFTIWHKHVDLIIKHHEIKEAYKASHITTNDATRNDKTDSKDDNEEDGSDEENHKGNTTSDTEAKTREDDNLPRWQWWAKTWKRYTEEEEDDDDDTTTGGSPEEDYHKRVLARINWQSSWYDNIASMEYLSYMRKGRRGKSDLDDAEDTDEFEGLQKTDLMIWFINTTHIH